MISGSALKTRGATTFNEGEPGSSGAEEQGSRGAEGQRRKGAITDFGFRISDFGMPPTYPVCPQITQMNADCFE
jgi:hypothetical protein